MESVNLAAVIIKVTQPLLVNRVIPDLVAPRKGGNNTSGVYQTSLNPVYHRDHGVNVIHPSALSHCH